jgi:hypothetical protein
MKGIQAFLELAQQQKRHEKFDGDQVYLFNQFLSTGVSSTVTFKP